MKRISISVKTKKKFAVHVYLHKLKKCRNLFKQLKRFNTASVSSNLVSCANRNLAKPSWNFV